MRRFAQASATMQDNTHNQSLLESLRASEIKCQRLLHQITQLRREIQDAKAVISKRWQNVLMAKEKEWVVKHDEQIQALLRIIQHQEQIQAQQQEELLELRSQAANTHTPTSVSRCTQTLCQIQESGKGITRRGPQSKHRSSDASTTFMQVCTIACLIRVFSNSEYGVIESVSGRPPMRIDS